MICLYLALSLGHMAAIDAVYAEQNVQALSDSVVAFVDVNVVPMTEERILMRHTVVIRNGIVAEVGPSESVPVPDDAVQIQGDGRFLLPGLTDAHVHLRDASELLSYLRFGVTNVVQLSGPNGTVTDVLDLRDRVLSGELAGPTIYSSGRILDGDPPVFRGVSTVVTSAPQAMSVVNEQVDAGFDFIKVYNNLPDGALRAVIERAHERGRAVFGHIPRLPDRSQALQKALDANLDVIAHGEEFFFTYFYDGVEDLLDRGEIPYRDPARIADAVRLTRDAGAWVTPNLSFVAMTRRQLDDLQSILSNPEHDFLHPDVAEMWDEQNFTRRSDLDRFDRRERAKYAFVQALTRALNAAGVPLLLGTDSSAPGLYPGASAHLELGELVKAGLTPYEALVTGTRNPGSFIERHVEGTEAFGTIARGARADLLLLSASPLAKIENIASIEGVMIRGRWLSRDELDRMREAATAGVSR